MLWCQGVPVVKPLPSPKHALRRSLSAKRQTVGDQCRGDMGKGSREIEVWVAETVESPCYAVKSPLNL